MGGEYGWRTRIPYLRPGHFPSNAIIESKSTLDICGYTKGEAENEISEILIPPPCLNKQRIL